MKNKGLINQLIHREGECNEYVKQEDQDVNLLIVSEGK